LRARYIDKSAPNAFFGLQEQLTGRVKRRVLAGTMVANISRPAPHLRRAT
jgi:hypothetical protein